MQISRGAAEKLLEKRGPEYCAEWTVAQRFVPSERVKTTRAALVVDAIRHLYPFPEAYERWKRAQRAEAAQIPLAAPTEDQLAEGRVRARQLLEQARALKHPHNPPESAQDRSECTTVALSTSAEAKVAS